MGVAMTTENYSWAPGAPPPLLTTDPRPQDKTTAFIHCK